VNGNFNILNDDVGKEEEKVQVKYQILKCNVKKNKIRTKGSISGSKRSKKKSFK
jgi:hypothetical protein